MSPLMMRLFTLVGIALALASLQSRARAEAPGAAEAHLAEVAIVARQ